MKRLLIALLCLMFVGVMIGQQKVNYTAYTSLDSSEVKNIYIPTSLFGSGESIGYLSVGYTGRAVRAWADSAEAVDSFNCEFRSGVYINKHGLKDTLWSLPIKLATDAWLYMANEALEDSSRPNYMNYLQSEIMSNSNKEDVGYFTADIYWFKVWRNSYGAEDTSSTGANVKYDVFIPMTSEGGG